LVNLIDKIENKRKNKELDDFITDKLVNMGIEFDLD
jgi:hypothetical protein